MKKELFVDSDVLANHLVAKSGGASLLHSLVRIGQCFTSVLHATELLAAASNPRARYLAESVLGGIHVLGFHQRYAKVFADTHASASVHSMLRMSITAGMCLISQLPLVTFHPNRYLTYMNLQLIDAGRLHNPQAWSDIIAAMQKELKA